MNRPAGNPNLAMADEAPTTGSAPPLQWHLDHALAAHPLVAPLLQRRVDFVLTLSWWCLDHALSLMQCRLRLALVWRFMSAPCLVMPHVPTPQALRRELFQPQLAGSMLADPSAAGAVLTTGSAPLICALDCEESTSLMSVLANLAFTATLPPV
jgi:hypothetical protein